MTPSDLVAIVKTLAPSVLQVVTSETAPLAARLAVAEVKLETVRDGRDGTPGRDGKDADPPDVEAIARRAADLIPVPKDGRDAEAPDLDAIAQKAALLIPPPLDGKDADPALVLELKAEIIALSAQLAASDQRMEALLREMRQLVETQVAAAVAAIPTRIPKDGASVTVADVAPMIAAEVRTVVAAIPPAKDGTDGASVDPATVEAMVVDHVAQALAALPAPKDGTSVTVDDVAPLITEEVQKAVAMIPASKDGAPGRDGKDGVGLAGLLVRHDGMVVGTLSDGSLHELGPTGKDGAPGEKGADGKDGADGLGMEDFDIIQDHERQFRMRWAKGDRVVEKSFVLPVTIFRGIWDREAPYQRGDQLTYAGSQWMCKQDHAGNKQPGTNEGADYWQLCVKRGNDGKPGPPGPQGPKGLDGKRS